MNLEEYQQGCKETAVYGAGAIAAIKTLSSTDLALYLRLMYCTSKLASEAGETSQEVSKALRDDKGTITSARKDKIFKELGDVCWYVAMTCSELGFKLEDVMEWNLTKLRDRQERDTLSGSGSER